MGASEWSYFVLYQPDIQTALDTLRQQVFERGDYPFVDWGVDDIEDDDAYIDQEVRIHYREEDWEEQRKALREWITEKRSLGDKPKSIAEVMRWNAEEGTGTILDIEFISSHVEYNALAPLSLEELIRIFGTEKPTHEMIVAHERTVMSLRQRDQGTYIVVYNDDQPDEIFFTGFSGD